MAHLVLSKPQCWILELLNGLLIKVAVFLPQLQQLEGGLIEERRL